MIGINSAHHQRQRENVWFVPVDFVVVPAFMVELTLFNSVAGDEHVDAGLGTEEALVPQVAKQTIDVAGPLVRRPKLITPLHGKYTTGEIAEDCVDGESVLEVHWESFVLVRETAVNIFFGFLY